MEHFSSNNLKGRTLASHPEDLPFKDGAFGLSISTRQGIGWFADSAFDAYWSVREMLRVTRSDGVVCIGLGDGVGGHRLNRLETVRVGENQRRITAAISRLAGEDLGRAKIATVHDYSDQPAPQINISIR